MSLLYILRYQLVGLLAIPSKTIEDKFLNTLIVIVFLNLFDVLQGCMAFALRGLSQQVPASIIAFFNYYIVQNCIAIYFAKYLEYGVVGIWIGYGSACAGCCIMNAILLFRVDIKKIQRNVLRKLSSDDKVRNSKVFDYEEKKNNDVDKNIY
jgi:Na+-driven multidrug efflux pump